MSLKRYFLWCWPSVLFLAASQLVVSLFAVSLFAGSLFAGSLFAGSLFAGAEDKDSVPQFNDEQIAFFEKQIEPLLKMHCLKCHGGESKIRGGLRLTSRDAAVRGGESGAAIDTAKPLESLLLSAVNYKDYEMPPSGKLPQEKIDLITKWLEMGAPWTPGTDEPAAAEHKQLTITEEDRNWWAYRKLVRPDVPKVKNGSWVTSPIDAFILQQLEANGLNPVKPADKIALIRRATYDLIGLPPTPAEIDAFVNDNSPAAYENLIDRLLESDHYGEKWGRHWLDLVRYAETHGYERDSTKPFAWRYRDYVIRAFNEDKPYSQFMLEQLAGDELDDVTTDSLTATGYYRLGIWDDEPADRKLALFDMFDDIVSTTSQVFMGMTVGCARCHDHKRDPIAQSDYYRMVAIFRDVHYTNGSNTRDFMDQKQREKADRVQQLQDEKQAAIYNQVFQLKEAFKQQLQLKHPDVPLDNLPTADLVELKYRFYRDTWNELPDFTNLRPETAGELASNFLTLAPASRKDAIGLVFDGRLQVPADGEYTFHLDTTDGSRLLIDGKQVDERKARGRQNRDVTATLKKGLVPFRLEYFHNVGQPQLNISWSGPDFARKPLSDSVSQFSQPAAILPDSRQTGQDWKYSFEAPKDDWNRLDFDDVAWKTGQGGFGTNGTPGSVVRTTWNSRDIWMRREFNVTKMPRGLALSYHHDEDVEVYLNGRKIFERKSYIAKYEQVTLPAETLSAVNKGANVLAVHCSQTGGGQFVDIGLLDTYVKPDLNQLILAHGQELLGNQRLAEYQKLQKQLIALRSTPPPETGALKIMSVSEGGSASTHVLIRGNPHVEGEPVTAGFPRVVAAQDVAVPERTKHNTSGRRKQFAEWLASDDNPVTARVMANRLWQHHFGRGLCGTPNDFGKLGVLATHPDLLDWLAVELRAGGWTLKRMHKTIMLSSTYRMSSSDEKVALAQDPANNLFWRYNMRRLTAEEIRDSILSVNGRLNTAMHGPSFYPTIPREVLAGQSVPGSGWGKSPPEQQARRSVYIFIKRSLVPPELANFDFADTDSSCAARFTTTVPTQSLNLLNSAFMHEQAALLAIRLKTEAGDDQSKRIAAGLRLVIGRKPNQAEVDWGLDLIKKWQSEDEISAEKALDYFCLLLLNLNEFVFVD
ncbi:MAG: hypothetical protein ACI9G1_000343 [Pirellulaceae bacterium]|jgi:hypothetical protein